MVEVRLDIVYCLLKDRENICEKNSNPQSDTNLDIFIVIGRDLWS